MVALIAYTRLGQRHGNRRIYLQGSRVASAGFSPGDQFSLRYDPTHDALELTLCPQGDFKVSRRQINKAVIPVIDINNRDLTHIAAHVERAAITYQPGKIIVRIHQDHLAETARLTRVIESLKTSRPLTVGSLCHGIGAMDLALHRGFARENLATELSFAVEQDCDTLEVSLANNPVWTDTSLAIQGRLEDTERRLLPTVDILTASLPCTGASRSGLAKNQIEQAEDHPTAGHLYIDFLDLVRQCQPGLVVFENVLPYRYTPGMTAIDKALTLWGYQCSYITLAGPSMGALEARERMVMIAVTNGLALDLSNIPPVRVKEPRLADILEPIGPDADNWRSVHTLLAKAERDAARGNNFKPAPVYPHSTTIPSMGAGYSRWRSTEPRIPHPTRPATERILTPLEHARAKTIPFELVTGLPPYRQHRALGNSVIFCAFEALGAAIARALRSTKRPAVPLSQLNLFVA